jgi:hypothetical protein
MSTAARYIVAVLAVLLPGAALVRRDEWERGEPIEIAALALGGSAALYAVTIWFLPYLHLPLRAFAILALLGGGAWLATRGRGGPAAAIRAWRSEPRLALVGAAFVLGMVAVREVFAFTRIGFSNGDMTAHAYMAELIALRDGMPLSHEPLLPIRGFGQLSPGFHVLSALATLFTGVPTYRTTIHVLALTLAALAFALYALVRALGVPRGPAMLGSAGALLLARNPQFFEQWGGAPTLLAAVLVFLLAREGLALTEPLPPSRLARAGLLAAGAVLSHLLPVASFLYVFGAIGLTHLVRTASLATLRRFALQGLVLAFVGGLLVVPFVGAMPFGIRPEVADWVRAWFQEEGSRALSLERRLFPGAILGAATWPFYLLFYLGLLPSALLAGGLALRLWRGRDRATTAALAVMAIHAVLYAGSYGEFLPLWPLLYPTRVGIWLTLPLAIALAGIAASLAPRLSRRAWLALGCAWLVLFAAEGALLARGPRRGVLFYEEARSGGGSPPRILAHETVGGAFWVATLSRDNARLTADDLAAFAWLRENTPPGAVVANRIAESGAMIPAIAHRKITEPHYYWFFYDDQFEPWRRSVRPDYAFYSSEPPTGALHPGAEVVFRSGEARIYRTKEP